MSGERVKAKKKSAKKTAAASAPAAKGVRLNEFVIGNVRCFAEEQSVPIRPITLLVGENSVGKTTFLGCYQRFVDMLQIAPVSTPEGEFSRQPFSMGGFREIVRNVGGKQKSREFFVGGVIAGQNRVETPISLRCFFGDKNEEARALRMVFTFPGDDKFEISKLGTIEGEDGDVNWDTFSFSHSDFCCKGAFVDGVMNELNCHTITQMISMTQFASDELGKINGIPRSFFKRAEKHRLQDYKNMWNFLGEKFHFEGGDGSRGTLIIRIAGLFSGIGDCVAVAPIRPMPRRNYEFAINGGMEERFLIHLARMSRVAPKKWNKLRARLVEFGVQSDMFSNLKLETHGQKADAPFSFRVTIQGVDANVADVGYGISQLIPFLGRVVDASLEKDPKHFLFQQPEDHLHPRAQAEFASFIANAAKKDGHTFLVETHSDFIVDRIRICMADGLIEPKDVALLYFEPQKSKGAVKIHPIELNSKGEPAENPPKGYRDFFLRETERMLGFRD